MAKCSSVHPEDPQRACLRAPTDHADHQDSDGVWPNAEVQQQMLLRRTQKTPKGRKRGRNSTLSAIAAAVASNREAFNGESPIVRQDDPTTSHEAAERYQPKRGSAKAKVLEYLQQRAGEWVDAPELATPEVGGFAGTRRLRELRESGWEIETRPKPNTENTWQHRLVDGVGSPPESSTESSGIEDTSISPEET